MFYGEGGVLLDAMHATHLRELYGDYRHYPFVVASYTPLYPLVCALGLKLFRGLFTFGRAVSCLAVIGSVAAIWALVGRAVQSRAAALAAVALFLTAPILAFNVGFRADFPALALALGGLYCAIRGGRWLILAVAMMVLAIYTKQSMIAAPAAVIVGLWWKGERRNALLVGASYAIMVLAAGAILQVASDGWFYRHVVISNLNRWEGAHLARLWRAGFLSSLAPFLLGLLGAGWAVSRWRPGATSGGGEVGRSTIPLLYLYFAFAMVGSLAAGKVGANVNYMLEPLAGSCVAAGLACERLARSAAAGHPTLGRGMIPAVLAVSLAVTAAVTAFVWRLPSWGSQGGARQQALEEGKAAVALVKQAPGAVLSESVGLVLVSGRSVLFEPFEFTQMFLDGHWSQGALLRDIERRRFALIVVGRPIVAGTPDSRGTYGDGRWTSEMAQSIRRNYRVARRIGALFFMTPVGGVNRSSGGGKVSALRNNGLTADDKLGTGRARGRA
jgi:hypothetical protein